jgi:hypothetical protein
MRKKIIIAIGAIAVIASLMMPVIKTEKIVVGTTQVAPADPNSWYTSKPRAIYDTREVVDYYQTGVRTFSIFIGTMLLAWIVPEEKKSNPNIDS